MNAYEIDKRLEYLEKAFNEGTVNASLLKTYVKALRYEAEKIKSSENPKVKFLLLTRLEELLRRLG